MRNKLEHSKRGHYLDQLRDNVESLGAQLIRADGGTPGELENALKGLAAATESIRESAAAAGGGHRLEASVAALASALAEGLGPASKAVGALKDAVAEVRKADESQTEISLSLSGNALAEDPELLSDFVMESKDHLASVEASALKLEEDPSSSEPIHSAFRGFHTIKGLAGFLEFERIRQAAHEIETLLDDARNGKIPVTAAVIDVMLAGADYLSQEVRVVEESLAGRTAAPPVSGGLFEKIRRVMTEQKEAQAPVEAAPPNPAPQSPKAAPRPPAADGSNMAIRVDIAKLDHLFDLVGELVIAQSMVRHDPFMEKANNPGIQAHLAQLAHITDEVRKTTMALRMLPIGNLFQRMKRLVRDVSKSLGKLAELELVGEDTELDKNIVDSLADPLMHMVRNAIDHGVELPADRVRDGKPATARIALRAFHQSGHMVVEIADDGRGLNRERILAKAREMGLISEGAPLSESEMYHLVFEPGFSTAEQVTDLSGRGVGMDVVKKNIERMRGRIEITTEEGKGTTFAIRLPLTLAIVDGLVVSVGRERYIVPSFAVTEMFRPEPEMLSTLQNQKEMVMVRDRLLPVVRLYQRFGVAPRTTAPEKSLFIVCESQGKPFCLMVDDFVGKHEVVIKGLGECFKNIPGVAGATILGDGRVGLILEMSGVFSEAPNA